MKLSSFDYELPPELIAQQPAAERDSSRLLVLDRAAGTVSHKMFSDLPSFLHPGEVLLLNESRVIPARLRLAREGTGGKVEVLLLRSSAPGEWEALLKPSAKIKPGQRLVSPADPSRAVLVAVELAGEGRWKVREEEGAGADLLALGEAPLPPYIRREGNEMREADITRYQTVYARVPGSVAAPTAGLHFTDKILGSVRSAGAVVEKFSLHVGMGTFLPVRAENDISEHRMDAERFEVSAGTAKALRDAREGGRRIVAVGTTGVRVLETVAPRLDEAVRDGLTGETSLFITPGFDFMLTGAMLTNFHMPRSTPFILVSALAGLDLVKKAYAEAVRERYRFLSYGDAMLVL
jgi:S-adenosylmethionine:tRNA ribosyltransferase-isomerase